MVVIGSRGSKLAVWQANHIKMLLEKAGVASRVEVIRTTGDKITDVPLARLGAETSIKGLFTKEIEDALLEGTIDLAVHSMKDMPTDLPSGLRIAAVPPREDVRDAIIGSTIDALPAGARIGTSALRRQAQLAAVRPDLDIQPVRGNVDTRLRKLDDGEFDAILLAAAGLLRLGWEGRITEMVSMDVICPAVGQGALAVESREGDTRFDFLDHAPSHDAVDRERDFLRAMGGGCQVPMGCHVSGDLLRCAVAEPDGTRLRKFSGTGPDALQRALEAVR